MIDSSFRRPFGVSEAINLKMAGNIFRFFFSLYTQMACNSIICRGYHERRLMWDDNPELGYEADDELTVRWPSGCDRDLTVDPLQAGVDHSPKKKVRVHCTRLEQVRYFDCDDPPELLVR